MSDRDWTKRIGLADHYGTTVDVAYNPPDEDDEDGLISLSFRAGGGSLYAAPTPGAARQVAAALLDAADRYDEDAA